MKVLLNERQLQQGVDRLAAEISVAWGQRPMTMIGVLSGCIVFIADLIRRLEMPLRIELIQASSYRGQTTRGPLSLAADRQLEVRGRHVLLVDDILDTGHTLATLQNHLRQAGAASVRTAVLLRKAGCQEVDVRADFVGFELPDQFVVGYGLDYRDQLRNLPYLAAMEPDDLQPPGEDNASSGGRDER